jgi:uncharacterized membrane protein YjfL (UPF0719 family)
MHLYPLAVLPVLFAQASTAGWHGSMIGSLVAMAVFALAGIILAIVGYKLFDLCTPGDLHEEILKNRNTAAAVIGAAVIIGVCIVVAAAIVG